MPLAGFLGFPPFALECYSFGRLLVALRVVPEWEEDASATRADSRAHSRAPLRAWIAGSAALALSIPAMAGVNAWTVRGTRPMVDEIPGANAAFVAACAQNGIRSTAELLERIRRGDLDPRSALISPEILAQARLMEVRGLGARGVHALSAVGISTVAELAEADPRALFDRLAESGAVPAPAPTRAEVRIWVSGARAQG
jgi:hypothetical protein